MKKEIRYRLYTEDVNRDKTLELVTRSFSGYTVFDATGSWEGKLERSLVFEIITDEDRTDEIRTLAGDIARMNWQAAVKITREVIEGETVLIF